jgi:hypothetical protein
MDSSTHFLLKHLLKKQEPPNKKISAVWRSAHQYASDLQTHDFASPPHDGFAFSILTSLFGFESVAGDNDLLPHI